MLLLVDYYMPRVTPDNGGCAALAGDFIQFIRPNKQCSYVVGGLKRLT
jgi:hypothetical protein